MPFYEYECSNCKFYVEALQKISDKPLKECPSCKKQTLKKLVSAPVFRLKGDGWYETDFKSDKEEKRNLADREEAPSAKSDADKGEANKESATKSTEGKAPESKSVKVAKPAPGGKSKAKTAAKPASKGKTKVKAKPKAAKKKTRR